MGILGIVNRTENWKTAQYFVPLFMSEFARTLLVQRLLEPLGETHKAGPDAIQFELFWKGMRDYEHTMGKVPDEVLADHYEDLFPNLREEVDRFPGLRDLKPHNYAIKNAKDLKNFCDNLRNTEIDIVLDTPHYLFIGEAKDASTFGTDSEHVLVHQLIRQYVTACILVALTGSKKQVIPFLVVNPMKIDIARNMAQVGFMNHYDRDWLKPDNILSWNLG